MATSVDLPEPWHDAWPPDGLETVNACPVCGHAARTLMHDGLVDNTFRTAPGRWTMWRCATCASGYLSPRPTATTIQEAYRSYYTHHCQPQTVPLNHSRKIFEMQRLAMAHGYLRARHGLMREPSSRWGPWLAAFSPSRRIAWAHMFRHLPAPPAGGRLLDVGCGGGGFLEIARACGWQVLGVEPDAKAARQATSLGLPVVLGDLTVLNDQTAEFDAITLSHVLEHVHDPQSMLRDCLRLLKPGGILWLETPNVNAAGHDLFGPNWRGLEPPRHLVLFSQAGLLKSLVNAGFIAPKRLPTPSHARWMFGESRTITSSAEFNAPVRFSLRSRLRLAVNASFGHLWRDSKSEFLTWGAAKPD